MKSYHYLSNSFDISHTVQATSIHHASTKLQALFGFEPDNMKIVSHQDYLADMALIREQMNQNRQ